MSCTVGYTVRGKDQEGLQLLQIINTRLCMVSHTSSAYLAQFEGHLSAVQPSRHAVLGPLKIYIKHHNSRSDLVMPVAHTQSKDFMRQSPQTRW